MEIICLINNRVMLKYKLPRTKIFSKMIKRKKVYLLKENNPH